MPPFIPGLQLSEQFYQEAVRPILEARFPDVEYSAALLGAGSDVLGFDDVTSTDHDWGPRLQLFLSKEDVQAYGASIKQALAEELPQLFRGYSTNFSLPDPNDGGTQGLERHSRGLINHRVQTMTARSFFYYQLGVDIDEPLSLIDWLTIPSQALLSVTGGKLFYDRSGIDLQEIRSRFDYYPRDVWLYLLAAGWRRISQEEHFMGRTGSVGDEIGSALLGGRLVRDIMQLSFLMEKRYAPYPKWFGTAFKQLLCAPILEPYLLQALHAADWRSREMGLVKAYETLARMHNKLAITEPMPEQVIRFHSRPFQVIAFHGFAEAIGGGIQDENIKRLLSKPLIGSIDQFSDSTDLRSYVQWRKKILSLYLE